MLPTPLISDWSSNARLMPVCRVRSRSSTALSSNAASSGSGAMCAMGAGSAAPPRSNRMCPNVRWSVNLSSGPESVNVNLTRTWGETGSPGSLSEEHTSELQSHVNLVCRLLLEKKKKNKKKTYKQKKNNRQQQ